MADSLPDLTLTDDHGEPKPLADYKGRPLVLFFFPRANTPGCTKESIAFSEMLEEFGSLNAAVAGVSKDSPKKLSNFREKQDLSVDLLSDAETDLSEQLGVWKEKQMYGKTFMGLERSTFLYGADGKLLREWRKVKVKGHAEEVLEALREAA